MLVRQYFKVDERKMFHLSVLLFQAKAIDAVVYCIPTLKLENLNIIKAQK